MNHNETRGWADSMRYSPHTSVPILRQQIEIESRGGRKEMETQIREMQSECLVWISDKFFLGPRPPRLSLSLESARKGHPSIPESIWRHIPVSGAAKKLLPQTSGCLVVSTNTSFPGLW